MLKYCRPSDIVTSHTSLALAVGTALDGYPLTNLHDLKTAFPFKAAENRIRIVWGYPVQVRMAAAVLTSHNLGSGASVHVQANHSDDWAYPEVDIALTVGAKHLDNHSSSPWTPIDVEDEFEFWSLVITGNDVPVKLGKFCWLSALRAFQYGLMGGVVRGEMRPTIPPLVTEAAVSRHYKRHIKQRTITGKSDGASDQDLADLRDLARDAEGSDPFVVVWDDRVLTDKGMLMRMSDKMIAALEWTETVPDANQVPLEFTELSRGQPLY